jgi:cbb3-type cytochrome oxidase subunit 3
MCPLTVLLVTLATSVTVGRGQVLEATPIDPDCKAPDVCSNLYFYDETDVLLHIAHGTNTDINGVTGIKKVAKVQTVGEHGCYTIYTKKNYRSSNLCWKHKDMLITKEAGYEKTVVRSVKYDPFCDCDPNRAGIPAWAIAVSILVVLLVAVAIFLFYRRKRSRADREAVPSEDKCDANSETEGDNRV